MASIGRLKQERWNMKQSELAKIIRRKYKAELEALNDTIKKQKGDKRKFRDEYYFNSGKEFVLYELAQDLGVELYNEDFELIGEEA